MIPDPIFVLGFYSYSSFNLLVSYFSLGTSNPDSSISWCKVFGSHLDPDKLDEAREHSGMLAGYEIHLPGIDERAHDPPKCPILLHRPSRHGS